MKSTRNEDSTDVLTQVLQDHLSPNAIAAIGDRLDKISGVCEDARIADEVEWLSEICRSLTNRS